MTPVVLLVALFLGQVTAGVVELSCSDNSTCIDHMLREAARSLRAQKTVRLFDALTIEPLATRQARSNDGPLTKFTKKHAFSFDWNDFTFRLTRPADRSDVLDLEVYESRSAKDVSDLNPKKSSSKVEEEKVEDKGPHNKIGHRRRQKKKVLMAVIPLLFGMKSAAVVIFAMAVVTVLTLKAFVASKVALLVTVGMAVKKLYESYSSGVGLNHPYLYSQYPIDFPSASSHAYSVSGVNPQFASPELYNPTGMGAQPNAHELLQQTADASAQQSQQAPTLQLVNATRAAERWDGKSKLLKLLEPVVNTIRSFIDPIAKVFYSMPATFRGLNSEVTTTDTKSNEPEVAEESVIQPKVILVPQPRLIAQRKMTYRKPYRQRPKKYSKLNISLERLKQNKDLYEYIKTKKYKYNYPHTFYYPKIKFFVNPNSFMVRPNNSRLKPYRMDNFTPNYPDYRNSTKSPMLTESSEWKPIIVLAKHPVLSVNTSKKFSQNEKKYIQTKVKILKRAKKSIEIDDTETKNDKNIVVTKNTFTGRGIFNFFEDFFSSDVMYSFVKDAKKYAKTVFKSSLKSKEPVYYNFAYEALMWGIELFDGYLGAEEAIADHALSKKVSKSNKKSTVVKTSNLKRKKS